ncbi:MAG: heat-inducible transcriptional repressor HrcA, partial [Pseudomonadota bacterium]
SDIERAKIDRKVQKPGETRSVDDVLREATEMLSGLSTCAGVVLADKQNAPLKHLQFLPLDESRALAILVDRDGAVENRVVHLPPGLPHSALVEASNFLSHHIQGKTLAQVRRDIAASVEKLSSEVDHLTRQVIDAGLAVWSGADNEGNKNLIIKGQSNLLADVQAIEQLDLVRQLFNDLETQQDLVNLLGLAERADGVKIFIGAESKLFSLSGSSLIVAPFAGEDRRIVGVMGVIGPQRLNYGRIIPMVDYTARLVSRLVT